MKSAEKTRFDRLYQRRLPALKLQGMSDSTMDVYARAVRRLALLVTGTESSCPGLHLPIPPPLSASSETDRRRETA
jgi:hypothetical protein